MENRFNLTATCLFFVALGGAAVAIKFEAYRHAT